MWPCLKSQVFGLRSYGHSHYHRLHVKKPMIRIGLRPSANIRQSMRHTNRFCAVRLVSFQRTEKTEQGCNPVTLETIITRYLPKLHHPAGPRLPIGTLLSVVFRCALDPLNRLCQMKASESNSSISFSVQPRVGSACKNMRISWKFIFKSCSLHFTRNAAQTYKWNCENPFSSACEKGRQHLD